MCRVGVGGILSMRLSSVWTQDSVSYDRQVIVHSQGNVMTDVYRHLKWQQEYVGHKIYWEDNFGANSAPFSYGNQVCEKQLTTIKQRWILLVRSSVRGFQGQTFFDAVSYSEGYFLEPTLMHTSIWACMSHYPRHVSGLDMPIFRRNNCTDTASGILALLGGCTLYRYSGQPPSRARIPDAVFVQLFLLKMGMSRPETCRG